MSHTGRYRVGRNRVQRWHDEWLLSVTQALAMLTLSVLLRWIVL
jgi:hypothetical protein